MPYSDSVQIALKRLDVSYGLPQSAILTLEIKNTGSRSIRAARGGFLLKDVYGLRLLAFYLDYPDPLEAGQRTTARFETLRQQRLPTEELQRLESLGIDNITTVATWSLLLWPDGTKSERVGAPALIWCCDIPILRLRRLR